MWVLSKNCNAVYDVSGVFIDYNPNVQKNCHEVIGYLKGTEKEVFLGSFETKEAAEKEVRNFYSAIKDQEHCYYLF